MQLFDSWAHHLSPQQFREFSLPYAQRVIDGVKAQHPDTPLIFHANGGASLSAEHLRVLKAENASLAVITESSDAFMQACC